MSALGDPYRAGVWRFDGFVLDTQRYELRYGDEVIRVEPQVFDVLTQLVSNHERLRHQGRAVRLRVGRPVRR